MQCCRWQALGQVPATAAARRALYAYMRRWAATLHARAPLQRSGSKTIELGELKKLFE